MKEGKLPARFLAGAVGRFPIEGQESRAKNDAINSGNCNKMMNYFNKIEINQRIAAYELKMMLQNGLNN